VSALANVVVSVVRSRTNTSSPAPFGSLTTRSLANEANATILPSPVMDGRPPSSPLRPLASPPAVSTLTLVVVPALTSRTNMSESPFPSPGTRSLAAEKNTAREPSASIAGGEEVVPYARTTLFSRTRDVTIRKDCQPAHRRRRERDLVVFVADRARD
jgi:hypothetical protein